MMSLLELFPVGLEPTGPYATTIVAQALAGTFQENVIVVPDFVPRTVTLPRSELLITTSASVAPSRFASTTPTIVSVIESPTCTFHFVRFSASPVLGSPPAGRSRLPDPMLSVPDVAAGASSSAENTMPAATSHDIRPRPARLARASPLVHPMAAAPTPSIANPNGPSRHTGPPTHHKG
jgi:hypothetical protein